MGEDPPVASTEPDPTDPNDDDMDPPDPSADPTMAPDPDPTETSEPDPDPPPSGENACEGGALADGFYVNDGRIYDNHCAEFVMRGVNYPYVWFKDGQNTQQMFKDIAATGSNVVRVVLATGGQWPRISGSEITSIIGWAKENKLVAMLEVHDSTGYGDKAEAVHPDNAVDYWLSDDIKSAITGQEAFVMVNIANEAFGNDASSQWESFHTGAVADLRSGGLKHLFIVDAPNWGQDWSNTMRDGQGAKNIFNADPDANTAFSVHMYDVYGTSDTVWAYFENFLGLGVPLLVGEFAADHGTSGNVDEAAIMAASKEHRVGYLGWSWSGNSSDLNSLDIVQNFNSSAFSTWGQRLIDGADGIRETSALCTCFE
jgi:mannan endo-1,4-beta-mannosidase